MRNSLPSPIASHLRLEAKDPLENLKLCQQISVCMHTELYLCIHFRLLYFQIGSVPRFSMYLLLITMHGCLFLCIYVIDHLYSQYFNLLSISPEVSGTSRTILCNICIYIYIYIFIYYIYIYII